MKHYFMDVKKMKKKKIRIFHYQYKLISVLLCIGLICVMAGAFARGAQESGAWSTCEDTSKERKLPMKKHHSHSFAFEEQDESGSLEVSADEEIEEDTEAAQEGETALTKQISGYSEDTGVETPMIDAEEEDDIEENTDETEQVFGDAEDEDIIAEDEESDVMDGGEEADPEVYEVWGYEAEETDSAEKEQETSEPVFEVWSYEIET